MHEYRKRIPIRSNLNSVSGYVFMDIDTIIKNIRNDSVDHQFTVGDSGYELFIYIGRLSEHSRTFTLNAEAYDSDYNNIPVSDLAKLFESDSQFRNFIKQCVDKYISAVNALQSKVKYFEESTNTSDVHNSKLYIAIYDFSTDKFLDVPEVKEMVIQFEEPDVDKLIDQIMKE